MALTRCMGTAPFSRRHRRQSTFYPLSQPFSFALLAHLFLRTPFTSSRNTHHDVRSNHLSLVCSAFPKQSFMALYRSPSALPPDALITRSCLRSHAHSSSFSNEAYCTLEQYLCWLWLHSPSLLCTQRDSPRYFLTQQKSSRFYALTPIRYSSIRAF